MKGIFSEPAEYPDFVRMELDILKFWKQVDAFKLQVAKHKEGTPFAWLEGPPTANGLPHIGHALTRAIKDVFLRHKAMQGYHVTPRIAGWDCHGLPVELEVERILGIKEKHEIEEFGVAQFNEKCAESVLKYEGEWKRMSERMGFWLDMEHPYVTMEDNYIESVWWSLKELWNKKLLYKGLRVIPWCPRCGTPLSSHEVAQGQRDTEDPSIFIKFAKKGEPGTFFLAWTTTPWTLVSNVALVVHPKYDYVKVEHKGERLILARDLLESSLGEGPHKVLETRKGKDLLGLEYEQLLPYVEPDGKAFVVINANYVTLTDGTGVVHTAPAFGADDAEVAAKFGLAYLKPVGQDGRFYADVGPVGGMFVKDADEVLIGELEKNNALLRKEIITHTYPFCPRCDSAMLYYSTDSWFIRMSKLMDNLIKNNNKVRWQPEYLKHGRFGKFLEEIRDWALSRNRYWGTPLPIWICSDKKCKHIEVIGSRAELQELARTDKTIKSLHKPYVDELTVICPKCEGSMQREEYVIDCWYDSGAAPFAQYHYPFENKEKVESEIPYDFITEAIDQTRGWFYTLLAITTALFDLPAYTSVLSMGHVLDGDGLKMSKSKGNVVSPNEVFEKEGADAMRWYLFSNPTWNPTRFSHDLVAQTQRRFMLTLWNVYCFFVSNANADGFRPDEHSLAFAKRSRLDKWILSRLNQLVQNVQADFEELSIHNAVKALDHFVLEDLSNWYVRRSRRRFWSPEMSKDKRSAFTTLFEVLEILTKLLAPSIPFLTETIYQNLIRKAHPDSDISVHLAEFPVANKRRINSVLDGNMDDIKLLVVAGRSARTRAKIKNRQPVGLITLVLNADRLEQVRLFEKELIEELNSKKIEYVTDVEGFLEHQVKPNFKVLAPKLRSDLKSVQAKLKTLTSEEAQQMATVFEQGNNATLTVNGKVFEFTQEDLEIGVSEKEGLTMESCAAGQVILDTTLTKELLHEGFARDVVRRIQTMRKEMNLEYTDHINVSFSTDEFGIAALHSFDEYVRRETQADVLVEGESDGLSKDWEFDGNRIRLTVARS